MIEDNIKKAIEEKAFEVEIKEKTILDRLCDNKLDPSFNIGTPERETTEIIRHGASSTYMTSTKIVEPEGPEEIEELEEPEEIDNCCVRECIPENIPAAENERVAEAAENPVDELSKKMRIPEYIKSKMLVPEYINESAQPDHPKEGKQKRKKVAIVGFAKSWNLAPFQDKSFEIWGLNELYRYFEQFKGSRASRWFEIHNPESPSKNNERHQTFLKTSKIPVYMWKHYEEYPASIPFPREEVKAMINQNMIFPGNDLIPENPYSVNSAKFSNFSNQITWMMLLAIYEGFEEIHVYGVDMATKELLQSADGQKEITGEYIWQRPSCEAVIGFALGRGIKVLVPQASELCKFPSDYGFDTDNQVRCTLKSRKEELKKRLTGLRNEEQKLLIQLDNIKMQEANVSGCIGELSWLLGNHIV